MSDIYPEAKLVLLHPPKTGGTSVNRWLGRKLKRKWTSTKHTLASTILEKGYCGDNPFEWTWLMTVRNPFTRLVSAYSFFGWWRAGKPFDEFVDFYCTGLEAPFLYNRPMVEWLPPDDIPVRVYKCENLSKSFPNIGHERKQKLGLVPSELYTSELIAKVQTRFAADFERFDYAPDLP